MNEQTSPVAKPVSTPQVSTWRKVLAAILDFFTVFFVGGYLIGMATGNTTDEGFQLNGGPALVLFALLIAYFVIGSKYAGGTLWQRVLGTR